MVHVAADAENCLKGRATLDAAVDVVLIMPIVFVAEQQAADHINKNKQKKTRKREHLRIQIPRFQEDVGVLAHR